ncbi:MAG: tRNA (adenosine(37)-N6)-threonylcarbamoyltransferase complex dimerization subunit type 1 TsaB, partial [Candidatus Tectomicrobia bacterium]|nr:tRNA (adenosine(37)-N6)-threonylcarbamoyltransferase complex dimerization subunit type 1 TsaB [Candidatus Tectomicrobia bacterium]
KISLSQELLPSINLILSNSGLNIHDICCLAVATGPGSFTGLRIGICTAKALALALQIPIFGVSTLEAMVYPLPDLKYDLCPIIDARKKELYAAIFQRREGKITRMVSEAIVRPSELCKMIENPTIFLGNGLETYGQLLTSSLGELAVIWKINDLTSEGAALAGFDLVKRGHSSELMVIKPLYLRRSEAEIKWEEKHNP